MKIWIDLTNAPHVRFFKNVIEYFQEEGEDVIVTARKFGDIHRLMDLFGFEFVSVGKHGVSLSEKLEESSKRAYDLSKLIIKEKPDVAVSKHSIELPRVSFGLGIPSVYVLDNEHALAANKLTLPLCDKIIMPQAIDVWDIVKLGADPNKIIRYRGTSEIIHFQNFEYNENIFEDMGLNLKKPKTILMRPEPSLASYLDADCRESVLSPIVEILKEYANILIIPRFNEQEKIFRDIDNVTIIKPPVDTFSLMKGCDLMIGAGGTMNREAAIVGIPVISCYPGKLLSVDKYYIDHEAMFRSTNVDEIVHTALKLLVDTDRHDRIMTDNLFKMIIDNVYQAAGKKIKAPIKL
jgi:predicted glycosyltransferase